MKALTLEDTFGVGWESSLVGISADAQPRHYYAAVPFVRRAVELRANAVSGVPISLMRGGQDASARKEFAALMDQLRRLLWLVEASVCLSPYGATCRRLTNGAGLNPTLEWLLPHAVWPFITAEQGLTHFRYTRPFGVPGAGQVDLLALDEVVYFWMPSFDRAGQPGSPPGQTAIAAASALANKDKAVATYFARGMIKATLLQVPADSQKEDRDRLTSWWRNLVGGVANAWRTVVVRTGVNPVVLGDGLKELDTEKLTREYRQEVAAAFNIPETMLLAGAANYATAIADRISFYEETVFPTLARHLDAINDQWLRPAYGVELVAHPEQTEARQSAQLQQAETLTNLVGQPLLTVDEGRQWLGLEPLARDEEAPDAERDEDQSYREMDAEDEEDDAVENAAEAIEDESDDEVKRYAREPKSGRYVRLPGADARVAERGGLRAAHRVARAETRQRHQDERRACRERHKTERMAAPDARARLLLAQRQRADLQTIVRRQAAERMILRSMQRAEYGRLRDRHQGQRMGEVASLRQAGSAKALSDEASPTERRIARAIGGVLARFGEATVAAVLQGEPPDLTDLGDALRAAIVADLASVALGAVGEAAAAVGMAVDEGVVATVASEWARGYVGGLVRGIDETTREMVRVGVATFLETPGMGRDQLEGLLAGAFSRSRAEMIATTEVTRAASAGQGIYQQQLAAAGLTYERVWRTAQQDACPVCTDLDGKTETAWGDRFPDGPPAHPRCRCAVTLQRVRP